MSEFEPLSIPPRSWLRSFQHEGRYEAHLVTPDGSRLVAGRRDGSISIWSLDDGRLLHDLTSPLSLLQLEASRRLSLTLHPDGARLFAIVGMTDCADTTFCWDIERGVLLAEWDDPRVPNHLLGNELALSTAGWDLLLWNLSSGQLHPALHRERHSWWVADVTPASPWLAIEPTEHALELWDLERRELCWKIAGSCSPYHQPLDGQTDGLPLLGGAAFLSNREVLLSRPGVLEVRSADDAALRRSIPCEEYGPLSIHLASQCVIVRGARQLIAIDLATGALKSRFPCEESVAVELCAKGTQAVVHDLLNQTWRVWELASGRCRLESPLPIALVPGKDTAISLERGTLREWPLGDDVHVTRQRAIRQRDAEWPGGVSISTTDDGALRVERRDGSEAPILIRARSKFPTVLAVDTDVRRLVLSSESELFSADGTIGKGPSFELWRMLHPPQRMHTFRSETPAVCAALERSHRFLLSGHRDGSIHLWNLRQRSREALAHPSRFPVQEIAVCPRSERLVSLGADRRLRGFFLDGLRATAQWQSEHGLYELAWLDDETLTASSDEGLLTLRWPRVFS
jgi:WD40 repeat protein